MTTDLLIGIKSVCDVFGINEDQFYMFLGLGMPVRKINNRWYGHRQNISDFFKSATMPGNPQVIDSARVRQVAGSEEQ